VHDESRDEHPYESEASTFHKGFLNAKETY
jgi:hypothetical protein